MPVNILVADDSATMRRIMELTFAGEDARVTAVESGQACVDTARQTRPDVIFADCSMTGVDGYGVSAAVKSSPGLENTAVIVMASQKHPYDEGKGKATGVDDHVLKPFDTQHVIDRVNQVLAKPRMKPTAAAVQAAAPPGPVAKAPAPPVPGGRPKTGTMTFEKPPMAPHARPVPP
ncbi:MAG: response regulator, partial [Myxococcales bacterium]|nr:response regulator [Myxococcales bacterium]